MDKTMNLGGAGPSDDGNKKPMNPLTHARVDCVTAKPAGKMNNERRDALDGCCGNSSVKAAGK